MVKIINVEVPIVLDDKSIVLESEGIKIVVEKSDEEGMVYLTKLDSFGRRLWVLPYEIAQKLKESL